MQRVDHAPPEDVLGGLRRGDEQAFDGRRGDLGVVRGRLTELEPEAWPDGAEPNRRRHREIELQRLGEQEHPKDGRFPNEIDESHRLELVDERAGPIVEDVEDPSVVGDAEGEVQVRGSVAFVHRERAHDRSGDDSLIVPREPEHALAESIALLDGEHGRPS
jgi:hypothetical protein